MQEMGVHTSQTREKAANSILNTTLQCHVQKATTARLSEAQAHVVLLSLLLPMVESLALELQVTIS